MAATNQVSVDADDTNIMINDTTRTPNINRNVNINGPDGLLSQFKMLCTAATAGYNTTNNLLNPNINNLIQNENVSFEILNQDINHADSIKDGTPSGNDLLLFLFPNAVWQLQHLKGVIGGVKTYCINNSMIERFTFTRTKASGNDTSRNWGLGPEFRIGYDAGLGLDTLFPNVDYRSILIETFGKYIDPSTGGRDSRESFPDKKTQLVLTQNLFNAFGYSGPATCSLNATNMGPDLYAYDMILARRKIPINKGTGRVNDANITNFFSGNASKRVLLQKSGQGDLKQQVIVGKGLGDKLQVIILWIRSQIEGENTGIATCDDVVALLCIILKLTFFLTSTARDDNNVKIDEVLFYNPGGQNKDTALKRYEVEYGKVLDSYQDMINLIKRLRDTKSIPVFASGGGTDVLQIPQDFYTAMVDDFTEINYWIRDHYKPDSILPDATLPKIYGDMSRLKKLTARQIFKLNKIGTICQFVRTAKGYTCDESRGELPAEIFNKPKLKIFMQSKKMNDDISKRTFYDLFINIPKRGRANLFGGMPFNAAGGPVGTQDSSIPPFFPCEEVQLENDPLYTANANPEIRDIKTIWENRPNTIPIIYKQSDFVYIDPILADIKPGDPILFEEIVDDEIFGGSGAGAGAGDMGVSDVEVTDVGDSDVATIGTTSTNKTPSNCRPSGIFDANAALRIELFKLYDTGNLIANDNITFWEVLNEYMEVFVYDPRYDTNRLNELIIFFNTDLYVSGTGMPVGTALIDMPQQEGVQLIQSGLPGAGSEQALLVSPGSPVARPEQAPLVDSTPERQINKNIIMVTPNIKGGSRRSTRRHKYRKILKTTTRKKIGKQSSRARSTKRRRNKKRRNITRKN